MEVSVAFCGETASVAVPTDCTTAAGLEAAVAAHPPLGLREGGFRLVLRSAQAEVTDEMVASLTGGEQLEAVPQVEAQVEIGKQTEPAASSDSGDEDGPNPRPFADTWQFILFPFLLAYLIAGSIVLGTLPSVPDWEGKRHGYMEGSAKALCAVEGGPSGQCNVSAPQCGHATYGCGVGFYNGTSTLPLNETTCYVQAGCRGVHFAEPEPSADEFWALPLGLLFFAMAVPLSQVLFCTRLLLCGRGRCRRLPLRMALVCGFVLMFGVFGLQGYYLHLWSTHVDTREAWARDGRAETCTVVTHPVDSEGHRIAGYGHVAVTSALCTRPMRLYLSASEHATTSCGRSGECTTSVKLSLALNTSFPCFTKPDCSVEAKEAVDFISEHPKEVAISTFTIGGVWILIWARITCHVF